MAVAGMVLGILAIVFFWTSFFDLPFVVLAIVFSVLGLNAAKRGATGRRMAVAGLTCAIIGALAATVFTIWAVHKDRGCADKYGRGTHSYDLCVRNRV
jgi:hypothetical protein